MSQLKTRAAQARGGSMRSSGKQPNAGVNPVPNFAAGIAPGPHGGEVFDRSNENSAVNFYQNAAREGVTAIGEGLAFDFRRELGSYLGGLNSTGALRSGAVESGADDIMRTYADRVGSAASQATLGAIGFGAGTVSEELARQGAAADRKQANKSSIMSGVGGLLGAGIGAFTGRGKK
jgi:hypothetical protein